MSTRITEERLRALQSVTDAALSYLPLEQMLSELLSRVTELLDVDTAAILLLEDDGRTLVARAAKGLEAEAERRVRVPVGRGFAGRVAAQRRPVSITDLDRADVVNPLLREKKLKSLLGVPLLVEGNIVGVLHVGTLTPRSFTQDDVDVLQRAGDRAALAISGRLAERERGLIDAFQRSLIPPLPEMPGMVLAGRYLPAAAAQLGGDWYDAFLLPGGVLGLAIGDVVGRGFRAAALMGQLRAGLRAYAIDGHGPAEVLIRLSSLLRHIQPGWGATVLYAIVDPHSEQATLATAGHPPPLMMRPDGAPEFVDLPGSVPLAALRDPDYVEATIELPAGSTVLLYSDGLVEQAGEALDVGLERLRAAARPGDDDVERLCDRLIDRLLPDGPRHDDAALLLARVLPSGESLELKLPAEPESIPLLRRLLGRWLREVGASSDEVDDVSLACAEACANAIEHAYSLGAAEFELDARTSAPGEVTVTVRDAGQWRPPRGPGRGRGMAIMEGLMDAVEIESGPEGTIVQLRRRIARSS